jgi:hypothetical protein
MTLSVSNLGDNPQSPTYIADAYIPDQLIAGHLHLVTDGAATLTGSAALQRGTVLGRVTESTAVATAGKAFASGTIVVAAIPTSGDTVTVDGTVYTFSTPPGTYQENMFRGATVYLQSTTALCAQAFIQALQAASDAYTTLMTYSLSGSTITATSKIPGTGGNGYTLATSDSSSFTVPATLTGGTNNTGTSSVGSISLGLKAQIGNYTMALATTSQTSVFTVYDPSGEVAGTGAVGTAFTGAQINFTITAGGTATAGDAFVITVGQSTGSFKLAVGSAVDGSQIPAAILVDYTDASAGDVNCGVYLMGEFNGNALIYDPSLSLAAIKTALRPLGIHIKNVVSASDPS